MVLLKAGDSLVGLISTVILARLLVPADFGLIAMAMSLVAILELLRAFGFDSALIQNQSAEKSHYDTAWTLNLMLGVLVSLILVVLANPAAQFYEEARLTSLILFLALGQLLQGFENIGVVAFRKDLRFGMEFAYQMSRRLAGVLVTIPLAFYLRNYWALASGMLAGRILALLMSYVAHPYRPRFSLEQRRALVNFSKWLLFNNALFAVQMRAQDFVIGKVAGAPALGLYNVSYEISTLPTSGIVAPINRAVFPGFAKLAADHGALKDGYKRVLGMIAVVAFPAGLGIASTGELLVPAVLGEKWLAAVPLVSILGLYGTLAALGSVFSPTFLALGRPRVLLIFTAANVVLFVPAVITGTIKAGVEGAAMGCLVVVCVMVPVSHFLAARILNMPLRSVAAVLWRPALAACLMFAAVSVFVSLIGSDGSVGILVTKLLLAVALGILTYLVGLGGVWFISGRQLGAEQTIIDEVRRRTAALSLRLAGRD